MSTTPQNAVSVQLESKPVITVDDITDNDNIGFFTSSYGKGYIVRYTLEGENIYMGIYLKSANPNCTLGSGKHLSQKGVIKNNTADSRILNIYRFDTRRDLYKWLSEE